MTSHQLDPRLSLIGNRATGRAYLVAPGGACSVVNLDAMELLTGAATEWQREPRYAPFVSQAVSVGWLLPGPVSGSAAVRWIDRSPHLIRIQYELNLVCNLQCAHCYCSSSPAAPPGQPTAFALELIRQAAELGVLYFDFTGGEPLVRADILELVAAARAHGMVPSLLTNCTLVDEGRARALRDAGVAAVQTSLDARTPALHDEIRGKRGAFDRAVRGIRAFQAAGVPVSVSVCLNRRNAHETAAIASFLRDELRVPFRLDRVIPAGRGAAGADPLALDAESYYELIRQFFAGAEPPTKKICDSPNLAAQGSAIEPACGVGASYMFIKHDGRAALCPTMTEAESPDFAQADLTAISLAEAWERHPTFARYRGMQCENASVCPSGSSCRGGCRSNAYLLHGRVDAPDEMSCNIHKHRAPGYRRFLEEYEVMRREGRLPAVDRGDVTARRRLPVLGDKGQAA